MRGLRPRLAAAAAVGLGLAPAAPVRADELTLAFVGDVMFGRYVPGGFAPIAAEQDDPFATVAPVVTAADLAFANLETPVMAAPPATSPWGTRMRFVATPPRVATLAAAGFDVVSVANNHHYDLRARGVAETPRHLAALGLRAVGAAQRRAPIRIETIERAGWRIAVIAATTVRNGEQRPGQPRLPHVDERRLARTLAPLVRRARGDHDVVIVLMHWGREYAEVPSAGLIKAARALVDAGASAVIGGHPHVLQPFERYRGAVIAYSLGDFLFDHTRADRRLGGVLTLGFTRADAVCLASALLTPIVHAPTPAPHPDLAVGVDGDLVRARVTRLSAAAPFATAWTDDGTGALSAPGACPGTVAP
ncbi:MAG: CapA family protein [Myxococcales bacterium]|nr:CapA family protein [Myxococcales bacterium]